jgi:Zn ribbon nucleic-acid-binding protein
MLVRHYSQGKWYRIVCPEGSRVERQSDQAGPGGGQPQDRLIVPWVGEEIVIPAEPAELLPLLAESGRCGLSLRGKPEAGADLAGATCPGCGEQDIDWLSIGESDEKVHCDRCGGDFRAPSGLGHRMEEVPPRRV